MRPRKLLAIAVLMLAMGAPASRLLAQGPETCRTALARAYSALVRNCRDLQRNEACVASGASITTDLDGTVIKVAAGERFMIDSLAAIQTGPRSADGDDWSITVISEGAGLPYSAGERVTMLLLGGASLEDSRTEAQRSAPPEATCYATIVSDQLNVRSYPSPDSPVLGTLERDRRVIITGKLADSSWWRIDWPDAEQAAWVSAGYARTSCPLVEIPTVIQSAGPSSTEDRYRDPFQIAVLRIESHHDTCTGAPPPGLLLSPPPAGRSRMILNGADFELDGTIFATINTQDELVVQAMDGPIPFQFENEVVVEAPAGSQYHFPLESSGSIGTAVPHLEPLDSSSASLLPLDKLPHPLTGILRPVLEVPAGEAAAISAPLGPEHPQTLVMDNRAGVMHDIALTSNAFPVLRITSTETDEVLQPYINQGRLSFSLWPTSDYPYLFELAAGADSTGTVDLTATTHDLRLCSPGGNSQSSTLGGGEDHAGSIWFGKAGQRVTLTASGDISTTASSFPGWRFRIAAMFLETAALPPIQSDLLEGHNTNEIVWEVPETGYYWIEVWTQPSGTTTVRAECS